MRFRSLRLLGALFLSLLAGSWTVPIAVAQIHLEPAASPAANAVHPDDPINTSLSLNLCVDGSSAYPCPTPVTSTPYSPSLSLTYGQVVDGVVIYAPGGLTFGTITLYKDPGTGPVPFCVLHIGSTAACSQSSTIFDVANYTLTAMLTFPESSDYAPSSASPVVVTVTKDTSEIALKSSQNPSPLGSPATITAMVIGGNNAIPDGQVIFTVDDRALDPVTIDATGNASFTTSNLALGTHNIIASYAGSANFYAAADTPIFKQQIVPPATTTTVTSNLNPSSLGDTVTFTATVTTAPGFNLTPSGSAIFRDGNVAFSSQPLTLRNGQFIAQAAISTLAAGSHSITAAYTGDGSTGPSVSPVLVQQVNYPLTQAAPGYRITVTPSPVVLGVGQTADLTITVTPVSGFSQAVTLSCSDLPTESACTFGNPVIPAGGGSTTLVFSTMAPHDCGSEVPYFTGQASPRRPGMRVAAPLLAALLFLLLPRRRQVARWIRPLLALAFACGLMSLNGCGGNCTDFGTPPGGYTFKVNGTASAGTGASAASDPAAVKVSTSVAVSVKL